MTPTLKLHLFGMPQIYLDDTPVTEFITRKALALFIYLASNRRLQPRDKLAALLWRDVAEKQAHNSLRRVLPNLRHLVGSHLRIERHAVAFDEQQPFWLDAVFFRTTLATLPAHPLSRPGAATLLNPDPIEQALAFYKHEFLDGFYVDDAPAFEEWVFLQREELRELALRGFTYLTDYYLTQNNLAAGLTTTQRLLALEPWHETAHYQRMLLFVRGGQRKEALDQYETCRAMLTEEFGIQPPAAMTTLYEQIKGQADEWRMEDTTAALTLQQPVAPQARSAPITHRPVEPASTAGIVVTKQEKAQQTTLAPPIYWGEMPRPSFFTGRQAELTQLQRWLLEERCCLISILGVGGTGKTALAVNLVRALATMVTPGDNPTLTNVDPSSQADIAPSTRPGQVLLQPPHALAQPFTRILWRSLLNAPPLESVLRLWLQELSEQQITSIPADLDEQVQLLLRYLSQQRCLLILDNLESILSAEEAAGHYRPDYEAYGVLIQRLGEVEHQSCLLVTSRELPLGVARLERSYPLVRSLRLDGLPTAAGVELLRASGLRAGLAAMQSLVQRYSGNPLALRLVAETVTDYYEGDVTNFLEQETLIFEDIRLVLDQQFRRLLPLEQEIMFWLTVEREPISTRKLALNFIQPPSHRTLLEAIRSLHRRSLVERDSLDTFDSADSEAAFSLQNVVLEYSTERLRDHIVAELRSEQLDHCLRYALVKAQATDYVRNAQVRLILQPIAQHLLETYGKQGVANKLKTLVDKLRTTVGPQGGYAAANLLHLAFQLGIKPEAWDFSQLAIWQADLRKEQLFDTNFTGARFRHSTFMEKFDAILAVAVSPDGELFAAGGASSHIHLWRVGDGELLSICRGRGRWVWALAFSPNQTLLASGGSDGVVRLWEVAEVSRSQLAANEVSATHHALEGHSDTIFALAFRPDGQWLASASADHTIRLWDVVDKQLSQILLGHTATVYAVTFSPNGQFLVSASRDQSVRVWRAATGECLQILPGHQTEVVACRFSPDGQWLVTASVDGKILVWQMVTSENPHTVYAHLYRTFTNDAAELAALALSPDGQAIATNGPDATIRLWSRTAGTLLRTFHGHTENVQALAFHPNGKTLLSGGWDQAVRLWDSSTGYLLRTHQGYTNAINAVTLSPDGQTLVSGNADGTLCHWQRMVRNVGQLLPAHAGSVQAALFHPDGRLLASGGSDRIIHLWQMVDGQLTLAQTFYGHRDGILHLAFSPSGHLLASSSLDRTVRLWDTATGECRQLFRSSNRLVHALAFSPDGQSLVSGSDDGQIYRWPLTDESADGQAEISTDGVQPLTTLPGGCSTLAFSADGETLAGAGPDHMIFLWRADDGDPLLTLKTPVNSTVYAVAFRPHQAPQTPQLASSSGTGALCFWSIDLANRLHHLNYMRNEHRGSVRSIHFTADGETLLSGSADETIKLWAVETGKCLTTLPLQQPYAGMKLTNATGLTVAQRAACKALGAVE